MCVFSPLFRVDFTHSSCARRGKGETTGLGVQKIRSLDGDLEMVGSDGGFYGRPMVIQWDIYIYILITDSINADII